jgi:hypothetical protein
MKRECLAINKSQAGNSRTELDRGNAQDLDRRRQ